MIKIGDKVIMNNTHYVFEKNKDKEFTVISDPWEVGGTQVVLLEGYRGGYALDGLTIKTDKTDVGAGV